MSGVHINNRLSLVLKGQLKLWIACIALGYFAYLWLPSIDSSIISTDESLRRSLGSLIAQLAGTCAGFMITAVALVFALPERPILADMRDSGHFLDLCACLLSAISGCIIVMMIGVVLSAAVDTTFWFRVLTSSFTPLFILLFFSAVRLIFTLMIVGKPSN